MSYPPDMVSATVREWHEEFGWGVLDSPETPGGCWTHFSAVATTVLSSEGGLTVSEYKILSVGESVDLQWEEPGQDGYDFRAVTVQRLG